MLKMLPLMPLFLLAALFFEVSRCSAIAIHRITPADWAALNASVHGRLFTLRPFAYPCYNTFNGVAKPVDKQACAGISAQKTNASYLAGQAAGLIQGNWGVCQATNAGCPISPTSGQAGDIQGNCVQGNLADYYIDVQAMSQIEQALKFANKNGIQVVIKNTGHDYLGRSTAPHALALWMHNLQRPIKLTEDFVPEGCADAVGKVVTFGAGQQFDGIYQFAEANNVTVLGGSAGTVGAAGGWITGGGHGMLTRVFGLGVDNVQQFRVVLPSGTSVTANRCENPDIFFALRGGGGGTFGVITEMSTTAHERVTLQYASIAVGILNSTQKRDFLRILAANANRWAAEGWGGHSYPTTQRSVLFVNPLLNASAATTSLKPLTDFANSLPKKGTVTIKTYSSWYQFYADVIADEYAHSGNGGTIMSSRLIPASNLNGTHNQEQLVDAILAGIKIGAAANISIIPMLTMSTPVHTPDSGSALTPAWRNSTWDLLFITQWDPANTTADKIRSNFVTVHKAMDPMRVLTPSAGVYMNEADPFEPNPPAAFWGKQNYQRLLKIKKTIDPNNVLQVHGGAGSDPQAQMFDCYPKVDASNELGRELT